MADIKQLALFFDRFGHMIHSAVPIEQTLEILEADFGGELGKAAMRMFENVKAEVSILEGLEETFPSAYVRRMITIGEETGNLDYTLMRIGRSLALEAQLNG